MCVTNTTRRAVSLAPSQVGVHPSVLSQRLLGGFQLPLPQPTQQAAPVYCQPQAQDKPIAFPQAVVAQQPKPFEQPQLQLQQPFINTAPAEKPKPKRRRKPQKPGKTAKQNDRHFVIHNYHDHADDPDETDAPVAEDPNQRRRGGVSVAFPLKLHAVLDQVEADGLAHIVSWQCHGRCFVVHKPKEFVDHVMPKYFRQTKLTSFQRQLNLYGFCRLTRGKDSGGYYHELFLRGKTYLCKRMTRTKVKGTRFKAASSPDQEPDFYTMPPITVTPHSTPQASDEERSLSSHTHPSQQSSPNMYPTQVASYIPEPLPLPFASLTQVPPQPPVPLKMNPAPAPQPMPTATTNNADRVLDEAVDELFLGGEDAFERDNLADFVNDWDPTATFDFNEPLEDDTQLGFLLDKLLEE